MYISKIVLLLHIGATLMSCTHSFPGQQESETPKSRTEATASTSFPSPPKIPEPDTMTPEPSESPTSSLEKAAQALRNIGGFGILESFEKILSLPTNEKLITEEMKNEGENRMDPGPSNISRSHAQPELTQSISTDPSPPSIMEGSTSPTLSSVDLPSSSGQFVTARTPISEQVENPLTTPTDQNEQEVLEEEIIVFKKRPLTKSKPHSSTQPSSKDSISRENLSSGKPSIQTSPVRRNKATSKSFITHDRENQSSPTRQSLSPKFQRPKLHWVEKRPDSSSSAGAVEDHTSKSETKVRTLKSNSPAPQTSSGHGIPTFGPGYIGRRHRLENFQNVSADIQSGRVYKDKGKSVYTGEYTGGQRGVKMSRGDRIAENFTPGSPPERCVLIVPKVQGANIDIDAELNRANIDIVNLGKKVYPSRRAALITCESKEEADRLRNSVTESDTLKFKPMRIVPAKVRIHHVPIDVTESEIDRVVYSKYKDHPNEVAFIPYQNHRRDFLKIAIIDVGSSLLKEMETDPFLRLRGIPLTINTAVKVDRCANCHLLGHHAKKCYAAKRPYPSRFQPCLDCTNFNKRNMRAGKGEFKQVNANHRTDANICPTKQYYISKWTQFRQPVDGGATGDQQEEESYNVDTGIDDEDDQESTSSNDDNEQAENETEDSELFQFEMGEKSDTAGTTPSTRVGLVVMARNEAVDVLEELHNLNVNMEVCEVEDIVPYAAGAILIDCRSSKGAQCLQESVEKSEKLEIL